jgi:hypothetical protein
MVTRTITKEVVRGQGDKQVVERTTTKTENQSKVSATAAKSQYRLGALLPLQSEFRAQDLTVTAGRRAFGNVWLDVQYDAKHKEVKAGVSYEW